MKTKHRCAGCGLIVWYDTPTADDSIAFCPWYLVGLSDQDLGQERRCSDYIPRVQSMDAKWHYQIK